MSNQKGTLYVVATPIGNLDDITLRACRTLTEVDLILAEDTRHSKKLLNHLGIRTPMKAFHDFNERETTKKIIALLENGRDLALISDAGTPLISDPGYYLVSTALESGFQVIPVPGPSALICALSAAGLPTDRFVFEGFSPDKQTARIKLLKTLLTESRTIIFYETPQRIQAFMEDARLVFGNDRIVTIARELTKKFETIRRGTLEDLVSTSATQETKPRGEYVVLIHGTTKTKDKSDEELQRVLSILLAYSQSVKEVAAIASEITGTRKNDAYKLALELKEKTP